MKKLAYISLAVTMAFTFSACSSLNVGTNVKENENTNTNNGEILVDDLEKVDFMDKDFDMSQIEQHSCCDE